MSMGKLASSWPGPWELESAVLGRISPIWAPRDQQEMVLFLLSLVQLLGTKSLSWCQGPAPMEDPRVHAATSSFWGAILMLWP